MQEKSESTNMLSWYFLNQLRQVEPMPFIHLPTFLLYIHCNWTYLIK